MNPQVHRGSALINPQKTMANYYTKFSVVLKLPNEAAQAYALDLAHQAIQAKLGDELPAGFPKALADVIENWDFETDADSPAEGHGVWLHTEDGGVNAVCAFLQHLLRKFNPQGRVAFEWSNDCSKPRLDAYGGGAAIVTARKIRFIHTGEWLAKRTA